MRIFDGEKVGSVTGIFKTQGNLYSQVCCIYTVETHVVRNIVGSVGVQALPPSLRNPSMSIHTIKDVFLSFSLFFPAHMNIQGLICASAYPLGISRQAPHSRKASSVVRMGVFTREHSWNGQFDASRAVQCILVHSRPSGLSWTSTW